MHEVSLCESIRDMLTAEAQKHDFSRVTVVHLEIGALSGVEPDAMRFGFDAVMHGSVAQGAELRVTQIPATGRCGACRRVFAMRERYDPCPTCQRFGAELVSGGEMWVKRIEVD